MDKESRINKPTRVESGNREFELISNTIPLATSLFNEVSKVRNKDPSELLAEYIEESREYEQAFLSWESLRIGRRNPIFDPDSPLRPLGIEGYFVGTEKTVAEAFEFVLNHLTRSQNYALRRYRNGIIERCEEVLFSNVPYTDAICVLNGTFGSLLAKCRALSRNEDAEAFRKETHGEIRKIRQSKGPIGGWGLISYDLKDGKITQEYSVPIFERLKDPTEGITILNDSFFKDHPNYKRTYNWLQELGKFGHPLIRVLIRKLP